MPPPESAYTIEIDAAKLLDGRPEVKRSGCQASLRNVMLNLFQHLFIRCKDVKRQRCEAVIKNKFCCNFTKIAINENSPCPPVFCSSDLTHPFTSPPLKGGEKESSPLPSPIGEGATHVAIDNSRYFLSCHCECAAQFCQDKESLCKTQVLLVSR